MADEPKKGWFARQQERAREHAAARGKRVDSFAGVTLYEHMIEWGLGKEGPVGGVTATVDTAGTMSRRVTLTRVATMGVGALAFKKKQDDRELYLLVEGNGYSFVKEVDPDKGKKAREFAAKVNEASAQASSAADPVAAAPTAGATSAGDAADGADELRKWAALRDEGLLSDEEFAAKKAQILGL